MKQGQYALICVLFSSIAWAGGLEIVPSGGVSASLSSTLSPSCFESEGLKFCLRTSCFATNLRGQADPLQAGSRIYNQFKIKGSSGYQYLLLTYPWLVASPQTMEKGTGTSTLARNHPSFNPSSFQVFFPEFHGYIHSSTDFRFHTCVAGGSRDLNDLSTTITCTGAGQHNQVGHTCSLARPTAANSPTQVAVVCEHNYLGDYTVPNLPTVAGGLKVYKKGSAFNQGQGVNPNVPATWVAPGSGAQELTAQLPPNERRTAGPGAVEVRLPSGAGIDLLPPHSLSGGRFGWTQAERADLLRILTFQGRVTDGGPTVGRDGPLAHRLEVLNYGTNGKSIELEMNVPCGLGISSTVYSPLMLFFDSKRPEFSGTSRFPLPRTKGTEIYWPEPGAPGYFLAWDKRHDGKITEGDQLFGEDETHANGFEALARFDENGDKKIDKNDKVFPELVLWQDKNSDGVSQPKELKSLQSFGIEILDLVHESHTTDAIGVAGRFSERETGTFLYRDKKSKSLKGGFLIDIWFGPAQKN